MLRRNPLGIRKMLKFNANSEKELEMGNTSSAIIANRYIREANLKVQESSAKIASGLAFTKASQDAAGSAISKKISADQAGLRQAGKNAKQGASLIQTADKAYDKALNELIRMRELATQVNNGALQDDERAQANAEYQQRLNQLNTIADTTRFGTLSLLNGGGGAVTLHSATAAVAEGISGAIAGPANTILATLNAATTGFTSGAISDIVVSKSTATEYKISMKVGEQTFEGVTTPVLNTAYTLTSTADPANRVVFDYHATDVSGITSVATFKAALDQAFSNATILSASADISSIANSYDVTTFATSSSTAVDKYALTYDATINTFKLSDSSGKSWTETAVAGAQTIRFGNGLAFNTVAGFLATASFAQVTFDVTSGTSVSLNFQTNIQGTDVSTVNFVSSTTADLGLTGSTILEAANAVTALTLIGDAINSLNIARANIGALQSRFESIVANNEVQIENLGAIQGTFSDLDYADEQTKLQAENVKMQAAISMSAMANQNMQLMLKLLN